MRIIGIDPGYAIVGYGIVDKIGNSYKPVQYGCIKTSSKTEMPERLLHIYRELEELLLQYKPSAASIEQLFFNNNAKTALLVGQARGVAMLACVAQGISIYEYTPLQVKQALVGYGKAEKMQVQDMVKRILHLREVPRPDDTADALAVAICHGNSLNYITKSTY